LLSILVSVLVHAPDADSSAAVGFFRFGFDFLSGEAYLPASGNLPGALHGRLHGWGGESQTVRLDCHRDHWLILPLPMSAHKNWTARATALFPVERKRLRL
jgi:hypothetical protein